MNQEVAIIENGNENTMQVIRNGFSPFFDSAKNLQKEMTHMSVSDHTDIEGMKKAKALRLSIVKNRKGAERVKNELKADALEFGKAVQNNYNFLCEFFKSHEENLKYLEDTKTRYEEEQKQKLIDMRASELKKIDCAIRTDFYPLESMSETEFQEVVNTLILAAKKKEEDRIEKERLEKERIEKERIEKERLEKERIEEENRIKKENEELKRKAEADRIEREKREAEEARKRKELEAKLEAQRIENERIQKEKEEADRIEREKREAEEARKRKELEAKLEAQRIENERIQKEKEEADRIEREKREAEENRIKMIQQGNDKIKIEACIIELKKVDFLHYECKSKVGIEMIEWSEKTIVKVIENLERGMQNL